MSDMGRSDHYSFDDYLSEQLQDRERKIRWAGHETVARLASAVFRARTRRGLSQTELAERVGTKQPNISSIENGETNPTARTIGRLAAALSIDVSELLEAEDRYGVFQRSGFENLRRKFSLGGKAPEPTGATGERWSPTEMAGSWRVLTRRPGGERAKEEETKVALVA